VSIVLYRLIDRRERAQAGSRETVAQVAAREPAAPMSRQGGFALVIKDRYLRLLAAMLLVATIINTTGEYVVGKLATDRASAYAAKVAAASAASPAPDPTAPAAQPATKSDAPGSDGKHASDDKHAPDRNHASVDSAEGSYLSNFYSDYYSLVNLLSFLLQALVVTRLLTHLGVRRSLFIMPLVVLGGWFALGLFVNITMVRIEKTAENSLDYSLHNTLRHALFLPTSRESKYKAKAAIDTFFFRMGDVIAGLGIVFLFVHVLGLGVRAFAVLNVVLALCWLALAARTGRLHDRLVAEQDHTAAPTQESRPGHGTAR
jgi:AAA family ATP:ADP antiporter